MLRLRADRRPGAVGARADRRGSWTAPGPAGHVGEAHRVAALLKLLELLRVPVAHDREVVLGRSQVLADGDDRDAGIAQLAERVGHLLKALAEPNHQAGLGDDLALAHLAGVGEHTQGALPARAAASDRVEPRHDLNVVVEHVGSLSDHSGQRHLLAAEVGSEELDLALGRLTTDLPHERCPDSGAVVRQIISVDGGDDGVAQAHARDRSGHAGGLQRIVPRGLARLHVAEAAATGAGVAQDHEGRCAAFPALANVGAGRLLAHRVQTLIADQAGEIAVALATWSGHLEPRRLAVPERQHAVAEHLSRIHAAGGRSRAGLMHAHREQIAHRSTNVARRAPAAHASRRQLSGAARRPAPAAPLARWRAARCDRERRQRVHRLPRGARAGCRGVPARSPDWSSARSAGRTA